jgi:hypothetical protein
MARLGNMAGELSPMSSNFTQAQRDLLNNVKQAVALVDKELQRIREQRIAICLSGFELDWRLACMDAIESANGLNKLGPMVDAHTDFQAALKEIRGTPSQALVNDSDRNDPPSRRLATSMPGKSVSMLAEAAIEKALAAAPSTDGKKAS